MSLGVLTNIAAIYAQNNLNQTQGNLQKTLQELSSGSRINSGADDAAGLAVADGLRANQAALSQSAQNAQSGVGLLQTADGALAQVTNLLTRATTLATEATNSTFNTAQLTAANTEFQSIERHGDVRSCSRSSHVYQHWRYGRYPWCGCAYIECFSQNCSRRYHGLNCCHRGSARNNRCEHQPVECRIKCCQHRASKPGVRREFHPRDQLRTGCKRPREVPGAEPDRHQRVGAGK